MSHSNLHRSTEPGALSMIGGAVQGGSAKPKEEREKLDREHGQPVEDNPTGSESSRGTVGGNSNDNRTDQDRAAERKE